MTERRPAMGGRLAGAWELSLEVVATEDVTPSMRRIRLAGDDLLGLDFAPGQDLMFAIPVANGTVRRRYTIRRLDPQAGTVDVDFVLHGHGPAAAWATRTKPGEAIEAVGPRGKVAIVPDADWHLFVGDDSAIPATLAMIESLPEGTNYTAFLEVDGPEDEQASTADVWWLHRKGVEPGASTALIDAVADFEIPAGTGAVYLNGEKKTIKRISAALQERGVPKDAIARKGYWVYGEANGDHGEPIPDGGMPQMRRGA